MPNIEQIEKIKRDGVGLNLSRMAWQGYRAVSPEDQYRLKFQGICSQRNPDVAKDGYYFLRIKIPFGQVKPAQLSCLAELAERYGRGLGHLTTRLGLEIHSVRLEDVPVIFDRLKEVGLTTKASCGDTIRNVVTCEHVGEPANQAGEGPLFDVRPWALLIQNHFLDLGPESLNLPRKMNIYVTGCKDCIGHARINDLGLVGATRRGPDGKLEAGFTLWVGGGLGANPIMAQQLEAFLSFDRVLPALEAVVRLYMDHGSRKTRAGAKLKFLIADWGMGRFKQQYQLYLDQLLAGSGPYPRLPRSDRPGTSRLTISRHPAAPASHTGNNFPEKSLALNVLVPSGEIEAEKLRFLADLTGLFGEGHLYFTREQNIRFKNLDEREAVDLKQALIEAGFQLKGAGRIDDTLACPGTAFCPVGVTPSLDTASELNHRLRALIETGELPAEAESLRINISGCPNSCAQHQVADIGLSGTRVSPLGPSFSGLGYQVFLGGSLAGTGKLALLAHYGVPSELLFEVILMVLQKFFQDKQAGETFTGYVHRLDQVEWEEFIEKILGNMANG